MMACILGDTEIITFLIDNGADVNKKNEMGSSAIFYCGQRPRILSLLESKGADMTLEDNNGGTYKVSAKLSD